MRCVGSQMRMDARRAALTNGGSIRKLLARADVAFRPNPEGKAACGRIASRMYKIRLTDWYAPTSLATPSTASRNRPFALMFWCEQALVLRRPRLVYAKHLDATHPRRDL